MNSKTINKKEELMEEHGIFGMIINGILGVLSLVFVTVPHKVAGALLQTTTWVNPEAKQLIMDLAPFIGAGTGITLFIVYLYKIKLYKRQIKEIDEKKK